METMTVGFNGNEKGVHGSDEHTFTVAPEAIPPSWWERWNNLPWWQKALIGAGVVVSIGATYGATRKEATITQKF